MQHVTSNRSRRSARTLLALSLSVASFAVLALSASTASAVVTSRGRTLASSLSLSAHDATPGTWGAANELATGLNYGNNAGIYSISCSAKGYCSAGGNYTDVSGYSQGFVTGEVAGVWGGSIEVPGLAQLNTGGNAYVSSVSCSSVGNCAAAGSYADSSGDIHGFVVNESNGAWGAASEIVDPSAIGSTKALGAESISCTASGDCTAVGDVVVANGGSVGFAVNEVNGGWDDATEITISSAFGAGGTSLDEVSCTSPGYCSAAGNGMYPDSAVSGGDADIPFVVDQSSYSWGTPATIPGLSTLNTGLVAADGTISCSSRGNCGTGGVYSDGHVAQAFVANETNGQWGDAIEVPGSSSLNVGGAALYSISCPANGDCSAAGQYTDAKGNGQAFVADEVDGTWNNVLEIPGSSSLFTDGIGNNPVVISCGTPNNCSAGGVYFDSSGNGQAFVVNEMAGAWGDAIEVPGTGALNTGGGAFVSSISCSQDSSCAAGGWYSPGTVYSTGTPEFEAFTSDMTPLFSTQAPLRLTSVKGVAGQALKLTTSGGSGTGKLMFSAQSGPGEDCVVTGDVLKATNHGVCVVVATKSGDGTYLPTVAIASVLMSLPSKPGPLTLSFNGSSSALSGATRSELTALLKKLIANASIVVTGFAPGNSRLAKSRAVAIQEYLLKSLKLRVVIETNTTKSSNSATVVTSKE
jgi:hypothetical protein